MIRHVQLSDAAAIRAIYQPYVTETAITFEVDVPTVQEFESRITKTLTQFPYLVACFNFARVYKIGDFSTAFGGEITEFKHAGTL